MNDQDLLLLRPLMAQVMDEKLGALTAIALAGGDTSRAYRVGDSKQQFFVKLHEARLLPMYQAEFSALREIQDTDSIRVPTPLLCGVLGANAFIALEWLELRAKPEPVIFARQLAALHRHCKPGYGLAMDNFIGLTPQSNTSSEDWVSFWQQQRLAPQLTLAEQNGHPARLLDTGLRLQQHLGVFFSRYTPLASLLHGDLWSGNQAADASGAAIIFDPASYYGDHQADLAMMELFGNPGAQFFDAYNDYFALDEDYPQRRDLYNLYHVLNHANMFGAAYVDQAQHLIDRLLAQT